MAISLEWFDEAHNIIYISYVGHWTWQEWQIVHPELIKMMVSVDHKVDFIVNLTNSSYPPPGALYRLNEFVASSPNNLGVVVFVGMMRFMKAIVKTFWTVFPDLARRYPFEFARTVAEADAILTRYQEERTFR
jgi:hypothetical protein